KTAYAFGGRHDRHARRRRGARDGDRRRGRTSARRERPPSVGDNSGMHWCACAAGARAQDAVLAIRVEPALVSPEKTREEIEMSEAATATVEPQVNPVAVLRHQLDHMSDEFKAALPAQIPVDRFARVLMTAVQNNP